MESTFTSLKTAEHFSSFMYSSMSESEAMSGFGRDHVEFQVFVDDGDVERRCNRGGRRR